MKLELAVEGAEIKLETEGGWHLLGANPIRIDGGTTGITVGGNSGFLKTDIVSSIQRAVTGRPYRHSQKVVILGIIGSVEVKVDKEPMSEIIRYGDDRLVMLKTGGKFTVTAGSPSLEPGPGGTPVPDTKLRHTGYWRVDRPGQEVVSESGQAIKFLRIDLVISVYDRQDRVAGRGTSKAASIIWNATQKTGNFGVGEATESEAKKIGELWVGKDFSIASDKKTLLSKSGLRQYRPPTYKKILGKVQANLESRPEPKGTWTSNAHLDIVGK